MEGERKQLTMLFAGREGLSPLAAAYGQLGQTDDALALVNEALATVETSGERHWEAEIYRIKGELLLDSKESFEAETCFRYAIGIARRQSAKSLELRAVMSLSRLLLTNQGKKDNFARCSPRSTAGSPRASTRRI